MFQWKVKRSPTEAIHNWWGEKCRWTDGWRAANFAWDACKEGLRKKTFALQFRALVQATTRRRFDCIALFRGYESIWGKIYEASLFPLNYYSCPLLSALLCSLALTVNLSCWPINLPLSIRSIYWHRHKPFLFTFFHLQLTVVSAIKVNCSRDKPTDSVSLIEKWLCRPTVRVSNGMIPWCEDIELAETFSGVSAK